jgi:nucleoside-diphosphate-sugar epimerase
MAAARHGVRRFVYPSSGAVYGASAATVDLMHEDELWPKPATLYALTKYAAESILPRIGTAQGVAVTCCRLGVVYGPWEYATGVRDTLSPMLQAMACEAAGQEAVLGTPWRGDYTCSRDIASGLVAVAGCPGLPRAVYTLATGRTTDAAAWCAALQRLRPGFRWRLARDGDAVNVESHTGYHRGAMAIDHITVDTLYRPQYDFATAAEHMLDWPEADIGGA